MKLLKITGLALVAFGATVFLFLVYQLWGTDLIAARSQAVAEEDLSFRFQEVRGSITLPPVTTIPSDDPPVGTIPQFDLYGEPAPPDGDAFGRIVIDEIGVDDVMFEGVDRETLKKGPGHMPWTPLPGQPGNAVISGHRTTYGRPFYDLNALAVGDTISVETALGEHVYTVRESLIVLPTDVWVTEPRTGAWLTLTTCHPQFSAKQRLVIFAEPTSGPNFAYVEAAIAITSDQAA